MDNARTGLSYKVAPLALRSEELWSGGVIQQIPYSEGEEELLLYCLGVMDASGGWAPLRVQEKVGYAFLLEERANHLCARMNAPLAHGLKSPPISRGDA